MRGMPADRGFTLIELLVSITLLMVLAVIVAGTLRLGYRSLSSSEKITEAAQRMRSSWSVIDAQLQSQFPLMVGDEKEKKISFTGSRESLRFTTNYSLWGSRRGYLAVGYEVIENEQRRKALQATESLIGCAAVKRTKLFDGMDDIYFEYYEQPRDEESRWVGQWKDEKIGPAKIRMHLVNGPRHQVLLVPLRVGNERSFL